MMDKVRRTHGQPGWDAQRSLCLSAVQRMKLLLSLLLSAKHNKGKKEKKEKDFVGLSSIIEPLPKEWGLVWSWELLIPKAGFFLRGLYFSLNLYFTCGVFCISKYLCDFLHRFYIELALGCVQINAQGA